MPLPIELLAASLSQQGVAKFMGLFAERFPDEHLKDLAVDEFGPGRQIVIGGKRVVNFGSDSFLGLDRDPRVQEALIRGIRRWGSHNGGSRAFTSVSANVEAEERIAAWLGTEAALIYPSVTLVNAGAIPGLVTKNDIVVCDEHAHNSIQEAAKIAKANGARVFVFAHNDPDDLIRILKASRPYKFALIAIDGVYSMSGELPPLKQLHSIALAHDAILYVDDAHGTGVLGKRGRGTVADRLGTCENTLIVGSLSKGFSCYGGFIGSTKDVQRLLKIRSNSYIFGGPVPPCYFDAILAVLDIFESDEYDSLIGRMRNNLVQFTDGARFLGYTVVGGSTPIVSLPIGDEEDTLRAGKFLFDRGYYVQSVTFPAVPFRCGVLRVQINANHQPAEIAGLVNALRELRDAAVRDAA